MRAELATIVAVRRTSTEVTGLGPLPPSGSAGSRRIEAVAGDVDLVAFPTPSLALDAVEELLVAEPSLAVGVHVAELAEPSRADPLVAELVTSLVRRATPGEVLVTDVVAQLDGGSARTFAGRGHTNVAGRPTRVHALSQQVSAPAQPTFGRAVELASLDWLVDELLGGSGRAVILEGEAGIGKTHLGSEALQRAESVGVRVGRATADELGRDRPGHLATALLAELSRHDSHDQGRRPPTDRGDHRFVDEFTTHVENAAQEQPVLLIAEDLHWADDLSLRALGGLAPRLAPVAVALVATLRPAPRPDLLTKLARALEDAGAEHHVLEPLDPEAVTSLVATLTGAASGPGLRDRLLATAGNPLFVIEMLGALEQSEALDVDAGVVEVEVDGIGLPEPLRDTVLRRLRDLPDPTVELLRHAALLGSTCELETLSIVAGRTATQVTGELLPAVDANVLARTGDTVEFRHDVIREAIVADLAPAVRREMHTASGDALARAGASPVQVARQLALDGQRGDTRPVQWLERAAEEVRALDPSATVDLLEEALSLAPEGWDGVRRIEGAMIEPLTASGRVDQAIARAHSLLSGTPAPGERDAATSGLVSALATRGNLQQAADVAGRAAADPGIDPYRRRVFDCVATSMRIFVDGSTDEARRAARVALESEAGGRKAVAEYELACWAMHSLGLSALVDGNYAEALTGFDESGRLLGALDITEHGFLIPHINAATAAAYLDDFELFESRRRAVMERCASRGEASMLVIGHFGGAVIAWLSGRWDEALTEVETALALAAETGADSMTVGLHAVASLVLTGRGRIEEADRHLADGFAVLERGAHLFGVDLLVLGRARRLEETGAADEAAQLLCGFWDGARHIALALQHRDLLPHVVRLAGPLLGDRRAEVLEVVDRAAHTTPVPSTIATATRCRGLATSDADRLIEAVEQHRGSPRPIERAETCEEAATACFSTGRHDEARQLVDEALAVWEEAGATNHIARLDALARANGVRRRRSRAAAATHGWEALSPKEVEVVDLVADGLSNPAIGERLYISRRTVETHLSHVFTKLGLSNRAQLAALVAERRARSNNP